VSPRCVCAGRGPSRPSGSLCSRSSMGPHGSRACGSLAFPAVPLGLHGVSTAVLRGSDSDSVAPAEAGSSASVTFRPTHPRGPGTRSPSRATGTSPSPRVHPRGPPPATCATTGNSGSWRTRRVGTPLPHGVVSFRPRGLSPPRRLAPPSCLTVARDTRWPAPRGAESCGAGLLRPAAAHGVRRVSCTGLPIFATLSPVSLRRRAPSHRAPSLTRGLAVQRISQRRSHPSKSSPRRQPFPRLRGTLPSRGCRSDPPDTLRALRCRSAAPRRSSLRSPPQGLAPSTSPLYPPPLPVTSTRSFLGFWSLEPPGPVAPRERDGPGPRGSASGAPAREPRDESRCPRLDLGCREARCPSWHSQERAPESASTCNPDAERTVNHRHAASPPRVPHQASLADGFTARED
jgi:hypothetical protein